MKFIALLQTAVVAKSLRMFNVEIDRFSMSKDVKGYGETAGVEGGKR